MDLLHELWQSPGQFPTSQRKCELLESGQTNTIDSFNQKRPFFWTSKLTDDPFLYDNACPCVAILI